MSDSVGSSTLRASGPAISMVDHGGAGSVGNYKGVMLCNRPFAGSVTAKVGGSGGNIEGKFISGKVPDALGINVSISGKDKLKPKRAKKETVLTKHKRWLADLQKTKDKLEIQYIEEMQAKETQKSLFQEQEKQMRFMAKELLTGEEKGSGGPETNDDVKEYSEAKGESAWIPSSADKKSKRPAWALVRADADIKEEQFVFDDDEGLLDFAANLNYEKDINDIEMKSMVQKLHERIKSLEREVKDEDDREVDAEVRGSKRAELAAAHQLNEMFESESKTGDEDSELYSLAKSMLDTDEGVLDKGVHSQSSVTSMLKQAKEKIALVAIAADAKKTAAMGKQPAESKIIGGPTIVVHEPSEGTRIDGKQTVSNLPYQHRNPAV